MAYSRPARARKRAEAPRDDAEEWLARFHAGDRDALAEVYAEHATTVAAAVARIVGGVDRDTIVHDVFVRLLSKPEARQAFQGGSLAAWLIAVARNQAIDYVRRRAFESPAGVQLERHDQQPDRCVERMDARLFVEQFEREELPERWRPVFRARFLDQLDQTEAARQLGMRRTTLAYQEYRIRRLLRRFALRGSR